MNEHPQRVSGATKRRTLVGIDTSVTLTCLRATSVLFLLLGPSKVRAVSEPGLLLFGEVAGASVSKLTSFSLHWTNRLGGSQVIIPATWIVLNGKVFHLAHIPFETRQISGGPRFEATPNTFEVASSPITLARTAGLYNQPLEFVNPAQATFTVARSDRGKVERVDLRLTDSQPSVDSDGDGMSDAAERLAGTDPQDPRSVLKAYTDLRPELVGGGFSGIIIEWQSVPGKRYVVERTGDLSKGFSMVTLSPVASSNRTRFVDATATGPGPFFYRIQAE